MPIYEFRCTQCGHKFEELVFASQDVKDLHCPNCGAKNVNKLMSAFSSSMEAGSTPPCGSAPSCGSSGFS